MDDLIIIGVSEAKVKEFKKSRIQIFDMKNLGLLCSYLGIKLHQGKSQIALSQKSYVTHILQNFKMIDCNPTNTNNGSSAKPQERGRLNKHGCNIV